MNFFTTRLDTSVTRVLDEREACVCILVACASADGVASEKETERLVFTLHSLHLPSDIGDVVNRAVARFNAIGGAAALIDACAFSIPQNTRLPLFVACMDIILSKRLIKQEEAEILLYLKATFGVTDDFFQKCAEVLEVKNRF